MLTTEKPTIKRNGFGNFDSEINLTPSLSAILNFAFNHEEVEVPSVETLSPLTLNHEARVDASMTNNKPITEQEQIYICLMHSFRVLCRLRMEFMRILEKFNCTFGNEISLSI